MIDKSNYIKFIWPFKSINLIEKKKKKLVITWLLLVLIIWFESSVFVDWLVDDSVGVIVVLEAMSFINFVCLLPISSFPILDKQLDQVFIDRYFKVPKPFYQLITIYIFDKKHSFYCSVNVINVLISSEEEAWYNKVFNHIYNIIY